MMNFSQAVILVLSAAAVYAQWPNKEDESVQNFIGPSFETDNAYKDSLSFPPAMPPPGTIGSSNKNRARPSSTIGSADRTRLPSGTETKDKETSLLDFDFDTNEQAVSKVPVTFSRPFYIQIVDKEVFVTEFGTSNIIVLNLHGKVLRKFSILSGHPTGLFVKGNKVLVTNHQKEIYSFSTNGELLGVQYSKQPVGVAVDENDIMYATEWSSGRIQVFNRDGTKSHSISLGKAGYLRKIQFDKKGNLYVGDHFTNKVIVFNKCGTIIKTIQIPQRIYYIDGIHINGDNLYVTDRKRGHGKVVVMSIRSGRVIKTIHGLVGASDVAVAPDGRLWVVDFEGNTIKIFSF